MSSEIGVALNGNEPWSEVQKMVSLMDASGVETLWLASHLFQREPVASAAAILSATSRLKIALMAMSPFSVHPVYIAMAAATLDELFPGRISLCLGVGAPRDLEAAGIESNKPLLVMREALELCRALLSGEVVRFQGKRFQVEGRALEAGERNVPLILAASGPKMLKLAGSHADGLLISAAASVAFIQSCLTETAAGEAESGSKIRRMGLVYAAIDEDETRAFDSLRRKMAFILRGMHHKTNIELGGGTLDQPALAKAYAESDWPTVESLVSDDIVRRHAVAGKPDDVRKRLSEYENVGLDQLIVTGVASAEELAPLLNSLAAIRD